MSKQNDVLTCEFDFENVSGRPLSVLYAVATCSCTKVEWPREAVPAGGRASIKVIYHRERYANSFEKVITVNFSGGVKPVMLKISGSFVDDDSSLAKDFPFSRGPLGYQEEPFELGVVHPGVPVYKTLTFANFKSDDSLGLSFDIQDDNLHFQDFTPWISALSRLDFMCTLVPDSLVWGHRTYSVTPVVDGKRMEALHFHALMLDDFSALSSEERNNGALFKVLGEVHHFGIVKQGSQVTARIGLENISDKPLRIRAVTADRKGLSFDFPDLIPAGSKAGIDIRIKPSALEAGDNKIVISLVTDSPLMPYTEIELVGCVK